VARVGLSRGLGFQTTTNFDPCLHFHAGRLSGEKVGIPEGLWAPKGALRGKFGFKSCNVLWTRLRVSFNAYYRSFVAM
jgi:hypothetical protein